MMPLRSVVITTPGNYDVHQANNKIEVKAVNPAFVLLSNNNWTIYKSDLPCLFLGDSKYYSYCVNLQIISSLSSYFPNMTRSEIDSIENELLAAYQQMNQTSGQQLNLTPQNYNSASQTATQSLNHYGTIKIRNMTPPDPGFFTDCSAPKAEKKCECGSDKVYGPNSNSHSGWCPKYLKV